MKQIVSVLLLTVLISGVSCQLPMTTEFITGFESGIFMRGNPEMLETYSCPDPDLKKDAKFVQMQSMIQPLKLMSGMLEDKNIEQMVSQMEELFESFFTLVSIFQNYQGGDFCMGLIFGMNGAQIMTKLASVMFEYMMKPAAKPASAPADNKVELPSYKQKSQNEFYNF